MSSHDFPADFPGEPEGGADPLRWTIAILVLTALALAALNAEAIANWTEELPADPRTAEALAAADAWNARTTELGLDAPQKALHRAWKRAQAVRWSEGGRPRQRQASLQRRQPE
jgi:hypothetical protein